jgi:uncharacterized membrane protein
MARAEGGKMRLPLLFLHISAGIIAIISGTLAMCFRKGSRRHAQAGEIFVISMLTMGASAVYLAFMKHEMNNVGAGILTIYLVATAWVTAKRKDGETSFFDWGLLLIPVFVGVANWISGVQVMRSPTGPTDGVPVGMHFFMGSVMLLAAAGDVRMLLRGGVFGAQRIVRHLWRMCFGLFIATGSFFLGQGTRVFPDWLLRSNVLIVPAILPLVLLIFWALRLRFSDAYQRLSAPRVQDVYTAPN